MLNYKKLIDLNPTVYIEFVNSIGQTIKVVEHPLKGDESPVIIVCDELQLSDYSDFYETGEINEVGGEYEVGFVDGQLRHGLQP
jgi:hypothetical protein